MEKTGEPNDKILRLYFFRRAFSLAFCISSLILRGTFVISVAKFDWLIRHWINITRDDGALASS